MKQAQISNSNSNSASRHFIYIDSIHQKLTKSKVQAALERFANIANLNLPKIKKGKKKVLMGYGTMEVKDTFSFKNLLSQEIYLKGKKIHLESFDFERDTMEAKHRSYLNRLVFASNVPKKMSNEELKNICQAHFGPVYSTSKSVASSGRIKPFGFILFQTEESATASSLAGILVGDNYAISLRKFDEEKPCETKKVQDRFKRETAKKIQKNSSADASEKRKSSSGNSSYGIEENDLRSEEVRRTEKINTMTNQQGGSFVLENAPVSLEREEEEEEEEKETNRFGNTRNTFPPSRVTRYPYSRLRPYESENSHEFQLFCQEMEEAVNIANNEYPFNLYEQYYYFSRLYPSFGFQDSFLSQNGDTSDAENHRKSHITRKTLRKVRKNHDWGNVRMNYASTRKFSGVEPYNGSLDRRRNLYRY